MAGIENPYLPPPSCWPMQDYNIETLIARISTDVRRRCLRFRNTALIIAYESIYLDILISFLTFVVRAIYRPTRKLVCCWSDVDECETLPKACVNGQCINNQGSYRCECHLGFTLAQDGRTCLGISLTLHRIQCWEVSSLLPANVFFLLKYLPITWTSLSVFD